MRNYVRRRPAAAVLMAMAVFALASAGCHTTDSNGSTALASVAIHGNTPGQISAAATDVFQANGYLAGKRSRDKLVFEKQAGTLSNLAYGNWTADSPVWTRVNLTITPAGEGAWRLECEAYNLRDRGAATEEQLKIRMSRKPYQKLLDEVAARLRGKPE